MSGETYRPAEDQYVQQLKGVLLTQVGYYRYEDPANYTLGVFAEAAHDALESRPYFRELTEFVHTCRPSLTAQNFSRLLSRGVQADLLINDSSYPDGENGGYQNKEVWLSRFDEIHQDPQREERLTYNLITQNVQSNIAERYKTIKLLVALYGDRFEGPPSLLDVGSSMMHGGIKLVYNRAGGSQILPFEPIEYLHAQGTEDDYDNYEHLSVDERTTKLANLILEKEVEFGPMLGVDITNVDDPVIKAWAKSCSFYPDELRNKHRVNEYDLLDTLDPEHRRVRFLRGDFSKITRREFVNKSPVREFDIVMFSTVLYQVTDEEKFKMTVNAMNLVSPNGLIVIQDALDGDFSKPYNYRTRVYDMTDKHGGWQEILRWENGRCKRLGPGLGKLSLRGNNLTFAEAVQEYYSDSEAAFEFNDSTTPQHPDSEYPAGSIGERESADGVDDEEFFGAIFARETEQLIRDYKIKKPDQ